MCKAFVVSAQFIYSFKEANGSFNTDKKTKAPPQLEVKTEG
jgi:hypothetical protein